VRRRGGSRGSLLAADRVVGGRDDAAEAGLDVARERLLVRDADTRERQAAEVPLVSAGDARNVSAGTSSTMLTTSTSGKDPSAL
jgi:hypothetical protein